MKFFFALLAALTALAAAGVSASLHLSNGPDVQAALDHISAASLRGNLSFLASDGLEGRNTPSRGLDIAAEFIASQFRRVGLEPAVNGDYFQAADFVRITRKPDGATLIFQKGDKTVQVEPSDIILGRVYAELELDSLPIYKLSGDTVPEEVAGKVVLVKGRVTGSLLRSVRDKRPALILTTRKARREGRDAQPPTQLVAADQMENPGAPVAAVQGDAASKFLESLPDGATTATLKLHASAPEKEPLKLRNVIGVLPGADPDLKDSYILVTAHYDHLGMKADGEGDRIYNGANDDGSGVVSLIELAGALESLHPHPRRTIVFMALFGEEEGLYGSLYYTRHPVFPLAKTIADVNIEQVGRTDDNEGKQVKTATFTGFAYSNLPELFVHAGKDTGVTVVDRNPGDDPYFARGDNQSFADVGIPAHTVVVALDFPDYHEVGDEWQKIDYTNMASIDRMLGLGILSLANDPESPAWNESNLNNRKYREAWKKLHPPPTN